MSKLQEAYVSTADTTFKRVKGKDGKTYHFKDGTPITQNAFNAGKAHLKFKGQKVNVAIPSDSGPGYERVEVNPPEASNLGKEIRLMRKDTMGTPKESVLIGGKRYETSELAKINERITERHGADTVFRYN